MLKGLGDLGSLMKMQRDLKNLQKKLKKNETTAESKDCIVKAVVNGEFNIVSISISEDAIKAGDKKKIEKSLIEAINNAVEANKKFAAEEMKQLTGGLNIPGLGDLF